MKPIVLPEEKLDELAQKISAALLSGHYFNNDVIRGDEIKNFAEHQQINKFLLFQIYQVWYIQLSKLRHPYFDFSHPEVEQELKSLRNLLSQHIHIAKTDFEPLLNRAVYNNLKLLLDPKASFEDFFFLDKDSITMELFFQYAPFFNDLDFIVNSILRYHQKNGIDRVEKDMFFSKMEKVIALYDAKSETGFEAYRKDLLSKILQRNIDDILAEIEQELLASQQTQNFASGYEESAYEEGESELYYGQRSHENQPVEEKHNFFETVIEDASPSTFDFSDDIDETDMDRPAQEDQMYRPAASWDTSREQPQREDLYTQQQPPATERRDQFTERNTFTEKPYRDAYPEESFAKPKTVEEALSSFLNTEDKPMQRSTYDTYKPSQSGREIPPERSFEQTTSPAQQNPAEVRPPQERSFPAQEIPSARKSESEKKDEPSTGHLNKFLNQDQEGASPNASTNYSRIMSNHKTERIPTVAERLQEQQTRQVDQRGKEIKLSDIPIHRQYQFVQKVFEGNNVRFRIIVDKVNNSKDRGEIESIVDRFVLSNENINQNDEVVQDFIHLLRSRH